ncbi:hypothetical protein B0H11DRAFT_1984644 [Mycena galericulata]|nr:hypothetical protein B0H11DRAFT_1984644 [Mycena galericulata]
MNNNPNDFIAPGTEVIPISPVSEGMDHESTAPPAVEGPQATPSPERKLTIRVPVEYIPPTPPPSASLPAIPPLGRSLTPVSTRLSKRASAPAGTWSASRAVVIVDNPASLDAPPSSMAPVMPTVPEAVTPPIAASVPEAQNSALPKMILVSPTHSAIHLPTAAKMAQVEAQKQQEGKSGADLLATPLHEHSRLRPRSTSGPQQNAKLPRRIRTSPSIYGSPSHVSLIDFDSPSEEDEDGDDAPSDPQTPSIPEEHAAPTSKNAKRRTQMQTPSEDSDLSQWAPEPVSFPHQTISVSYAVNASSPPRLQMSSRSRSAESQSVWSGEREGSTTGNKRRGGKQIGLLGLSPMPTDVVQRDVDFTMRALMSPEMFGNMLADPLARQRFREFLSVDDSTGELDCWTDAQFIAQSMEQLRTNGAAFRDLYISGSTESRINMSSENRRELLSVLQRILAVDSSLGRTQHQLLQSMYNDHFQRFVKHKIIQETHVTLGKANLASQESEGLGDTFVLTNPRLPDHPIVLVSDGFVHVTGYPKAQIIGRNCRFLQGPGTPPESVQRIRDGLNSGKGCTEMLLNYRRNGDPFYCLLCIIPVRDASGAIVYFIGGQTNVTGLLATDKGLGLHGTDGDGPQQPIQMSPALAMFREQTSGVIRPAASDPGLRTRGAAGAVASNGTGRSANGTGSGFFRGLFGRTASTGAGVSRADGKQVIAGAEAMINGPTGSRGFQEQYALFQNTYNKILVFKFKKREITFVSPQMLAYLGLPTRTPRELNASPLLRNDMASLLTAGEDRGETRRLREELKDCVRRGVPCSLYCGVKVPGKGILARSDSTRHKFGMMHMTPIKDGDNVPVAFVVIFG